MKLSILIPSIPSRAALLSRLWAILAPQITADVEVIIEIDACVKSIGAKRNSLLKKASGAYVSMIDDDDTVSADYVQQIMVGINQGVDCVSIQGKFIHNGVFRGVFIDKPNQRWKTEVIGGVYTYLRGVQHLDAVRREIALSVEYCDKNFGEDHAWSGQIEKSGLVKTFYQVPASVYEYLYFDKK